MDLLLITIVGTIIGTVLAAEANEWIPYLSRALLRKTLAGFSADLPQPLRTRWAEEIEGDFASYEKRRVGGLLFVIRLYLKGGKRLATELVSQSALSTSGAEQDKRVTGISSMTWLGGWSAFITTSALERIPPDRIGLLHPCPGEKVRAIRMWNGSAEIFFRPGAIHISMAEINEAISTLVDAEGYEF